MSERGSVLVVEDNPIIRQFLEFAFTKTNFSTKSVADGKSAIDAITDQDFDLVFTDLRLPKMDGLAVLSHVKSQKPNTSVIIGTAYGSIENAVEAMQMGASDYLTKPFMVRDIQRVVDKVMNSREAPISAESQSYLDSRLLGGSPAIQRIKQLVVKVANSQATVLIEGETGVGKEVVADTIHHLSPRAAMPFIKVNCAALPDSLFESELFGRERGAFTGAYQTKKGRFELANGGSILLDEIGEQSLAMQAKLLRVLQTKQIERLGNGSGIQIDTRVIATTNRSLLKEVKEGRFRSDLYFRLNVVKIQVPPLRSRKEDIPLLVRHFCSKFNQANHFDKKFSDQALCRLQDYDWPGNIRELEFTIERAVLTSDSPVIVPQDVVLVDEFGYLNAVDVETRSDLTIQQAEKKMIYAALARYGQNKTLAAETLGITVKTIRNKLKVYEAEEWNKIPVE